jgi:hypothetical protein
MKVIELGQSYPTLDEVIAQAEDEPLVLRKPDGSMFVVSQVDDFEVEVELLKKNPDFMAFLRTLSLEEKTISIEDLRKELNL